MPAFPYQNVASFLQRKISQTITPQKYYRSAFLYFLMGISGGGDLLDIDRPDESIWIAGTGFNEATRATDQGTYEHLVRIQGFKTSNTRVTGVYGNMPQVGNPTTSSQDLATMNAAMFRWCINIDTPVIVWNAYLDQAQGAKDGGIAAAQLLEEANAIGWNEHIDNVNSRVIYGTPSNQNENFWDDISGVIQALTPTATYGGVNRNLLASNSPWIPQFAASAPGDVTRLTDYMNTTLGISQFGEAVPLILTGSANWLMLKNQALGRDKGGYMINESNASANGLPGLAKIGITKEIIRVNNTFMMLEPFLDQVFGMQYQTSTALYTAQPNYVLGLNMKVWKFFTQPQKSLTVTPMVNLMNTGLGNLDQSQSFIRTSAVLECLRPDVNCLIQALT